MVQAVTSYHKKLNFKTGSRLGIAHIPCNPVIWHIDLRPSVGSLKLSNCAGWAIYKEKHFPMALILYISQIVWSGTLSLQKLADSS